MAQMAWLWQTGVFAGAIMAEARNLCRMVPCRQLDRWVFPKIRGTLFGVLPILGNYQIFQFLEVTFGLGPSPAL